MGFFTWLYNATRRTFGAGLIDGWADFEEHLDSRSPALLQIDRRREQIVADDETDAEIDGVQPPVNRIEVKGDNGKAKATARKKGVKRG